MCNFTFCLAIVSINSFFLSSFSLRSCRRWSWDLMNLDLACSSLRWQKSFSFLLFALSCFLYSEWLQICPKKVWLLKTTLRWETGINCQTHLNIFGTMDVASSHTLHCVWNRPSGCHPKIIHSLQHQFWPNFKVQLFPLWLWLLKNKLHFHNGDKMVTYLILMQQFLTLFNPFLQSDTRCQ